MLVVVIVLMMVVGLLMVLMVEMQLPWTYREALTCLLHLAGP